MDPDFQPLVDNARRLLETARRLAEENAALRARLAESEARAAELERRNALAREHVDAALARLPIADAPAIVVRNPG